MRTHYVLIDFENVQPSDLALLNHDRFNVWVFLGENLTKVPLDLAVSLQPLGVRAKYIQITGNGRNALDFHIAFYAGQIAVNEPGAGIQIVSKDAGYDPLIEHLKTLNSVASRVIAIADIPTTRPRVSVGREERASRYFERLKKPKVTRPGTIKALSSDSRAHFTKDSLNEDEIAQVICAMQSRGYITRMKDKVAYPTLGEPAIAHS